jgi:DNA-binding PadR family transcriptional regulator
LEYRTLTPTQITTFYQKSRQVVWRRLRILEKEGLIQTIRYEFGRGRGRPESLLGLTEHGVEILIEKGLIGKDVPYEKILVDGPFCLDHQLLLNWFRIHLNQVKKVVPMIRIKFLAHNSPFLPQGPNRRIFITDYSPVPDSGEQGIKFTPDAIFSISDSIADKTCLYFLEVDRGTETVASPRRDMSDIRQKIINYQW